MRRRNRKYGDMLVEIKQLNVLHFPMALYRPSTLILNDKLRLLGTSKNTEDGSLENRGTQSVSDLTNTINQLKQLIEEQNREILELKRRLNEYCEELTCTKKLYREQLEANGNLIKQWNSRYCKQDKRVQAVIDIANLCTRN